MKPLFFYTRTTSDIIMFLIYLDDILIMGSSSSKIKDILTYLSVALHINDLGDLYYFLGVQATWDETTLTLT